MRRAVGTRGGWEDGGPTVGTVGWDETSRCDGGSGRAAVIGYLLWVIGEAVRFVIHYPPSFISFANLASWR